MKGNFSEQWKALASPSYFLDEVLDLVVEDFHKEWLNFQVNNKKTLLLAPRSHGKSTIANWGYVTWRIVNDPSLRILICSNTQSQAESFLVPIKRHLGENKKLIDLFGNFKDRANTWSTKTIDIEVEGETDPSKKEKTVATLGAGSSLVGRHFSIIILDDIHDEENSRTELQREKIFDWYYNVLDPMLEPGGEMHLIGTMWHNDDLYNRLMDTGNYPYKIYRAIKEDEEGDPHALWEDRFSLQDLRQKRNEAGTVHFSLQYQNKVVESGVSPIKKEWIQYYKSSPPNLDMFQGVDISSGAEKGDYFAICTIGVDDQNNVFVLDTYMNRLSILKQQEKIKFFANKWDPIKIGFEVNALQNAISNELIVNERLPIKKLFHKQSKEQRLSRVSPYFELQSVYLKRDQSDLQDQLLASTKGTYDDLMDAFLNAMETSFPQREKVSNRDWDDLHKTIKVK